jgi:uncharacterized membrane protein
MREPAWTQVLPQWKRRSSMFGALRPWGYSLTGGQFWGLLSPLHLKLSVLSWVLPSYLHSLASSSPLLWSLRVDALMNSEQSYIPLISWEQRSGICPSHL